MIPAKTLRFTAMALALSFCGTLHAAESFVARITALEGGKIRLEAADALPPWAKEGAVVQALGWESRIVNANGQTLALEVDPVRLLRFKTGNEVTILEVGGVPVQACS
ncbi:MAG: hypothetical protein WCX93_11660 [Burkholderiaceae bacterium]